MNRMIAVGRRKVERRKVLFLILVRYSRRVINHILLLIAIQLSCCGLKLTGQGSAFHQPDKYVVQRWKYFHKGCYIHSLVDEIRQYIVGTMAIPDLYDETAFLGTDYFECICCCGGHVVSLFQPYAKKVFFKLLFYTCYAAIQYLLPS